MSADLDLVLDLLERCSLRSSIWSCILRIVSNNASSRRLDSAVSDADPGLSVRSGVLDRALVVLDILGGAGGGAGGGALAVGRAPDGNAGLKATALGVDPAGVAGAGVADPAAAAAMDLDSAFARTGAPNSFVKSTVAGLEGFTSKKACRT